MAIALGLPVLLLVILISGGIWIPPAHNLCITVIGNPATIGLLLPCSGGVVATRHPALSERVPQAGSAGFTLRLHNASLIAEIVELMLLNDQNDAASVFGSSCYFPLSSHWGSS